MTAQPDQQQTSTRQRRDASIVRGVLATTTLISALSIAIIAGYSAPALLAPTAPTTYYALLLGVVLLGVWQTTASFS